MLALEAAGVEVIVATGANQGARVELASWLSWRDVQSLLLEGGPRTAGPSSRPARSTRRGSMFIAPLCWRRDARGRRGLGRGRSPAPAAAWCVEAERIDDDS